MQYYGFFFINNKKGYFYAIGSLIISALYASRVGIIVSVLLIIFLIFQNEKNRNSFNKKNRLIKVIILLSIFILLIGILYNFGFLDYIMNRFFKSGTDVASTMRIEMWENASNAFLNNPLGYGLGNSINALENTSGIVFLDKNIHNVFLQMLIDTGLFGFVIYIFIIIKFLKKELRNFFKNTYVAAIIAYILLSFVQFRGGDSILFFIIGVYLVIKIKEKKNEYSND